MEYADISELDDNAKYLRATWGKMINYASTFSRAYLAIQEDFKSGKYGPEWTFQRWLGVKCGMSERTTYRVIQELHRTATDEQRNKIKNAVAEANRAKQQKETDRRATILAWNAWLSEEQQRKASVNAAMDEYEVEEKERINAEKTVKKAEKKKSARNAKQRKYRRNAKAKKVNDNKDLDSVTLFDAKNENLLPKVAEKALNQLMTALAALPIDDRIVCIQRIIVRLESSIAGDRDKARANGHNKEQTVVYLTTPHRD